MVDVCGDDQRRKTHDTGSKGDRAVRERIHDIELEAIALREIDVRFVVGDGKAKKKHTLLAVMSGEGN